MESVGRSAWKKKKKKKKKKKNTALENVCYLFEWLKIDIRSKQLSREKKSFV